MGDGVKEEGLRGMDEEGALYKRFCRLKLFGAPNSLPKPLFAERIVIKPPYGPANAPRTVN